MENKTPAGRGEKIDAAEVAPNAITNATIITGIVTVIILIVGILFIAGVFSTTDERGTGNVNIETNVGP